jgi:hypothetical protein
LVTLALDSPGCGAQRSPCDEGRCQEDETGQSEPYHGSAQLAQNHGPTQEHMDASHHVQERWRCERREADKRFESGVESQWIGLTVRVWSEQQSTET